MQKIIFKPKKNAMLEFLHW